jgi:DNA-binding FadR family transcriptional regulator
MSINAQTTEDNVATLDGGSGGIARPAVVSDGAALVQLRAYIQHSGFQQGQKLPPERVLGPELGLRRFELRKALETLVDEGMLWRHVGKGTFLARTPDQSDQMIFPALPAPSVRRT